MNDDKHAPTEEFVAYLARDTMRRLRHEARFAPERTATPSRFRLSKALAAAAGVALTLLTGMVLGASANYASAAVLPNGTTTIPARPALAILPIKNALSAIGCTQPVERALAQATSETATSSTAVASTVQSTSVTDTVVSKMAAASDSASTSLRPDRAMVALLAKQHQSAVVRGDTLSDYIVMALDASDNYLWSTHGNGSVRIEVGGDTRTLAERSAYNRDRASEFWGATKPMEIDYLSGMLEVRQIPAVKLKSFLDSTSEGYRSARLAVGDTSVRHWIVRGGSAGGSLALPADSLNRRIIRNGAVTDTIILKHSELALPERLETPCLISSRVFYNRGNARAADSTTSRPYASGWTASARRDTRCNQAAGMREGGGGESGLIGLPSANVSSADTYMFAAGELAPRPLRVIVVQLTAGTVWSGR